VVEEQKKLLKEQIKKQITDYVNKKIDEGF